MNIKNPKHDLQGVRQAKDLEQKYDFGQLVKKVKNDNTDIARLTQAMSQYMSETNAKIKALEEKSGYTKKEIDTMFGTYVEEVDELLGGEEDDSTSS